MQKVLQAIKILSPHKWPGPDSLPTMYYKKIADTLALLLTKVLNIHLKQEFFWQESPMAIISMIPKPNTCNTTWSNYRPISFWIWMSNLLQKFLHSILTQYQADPSTMIRLGLYPNKRGDSIQKATLLIHVAQKFSIPAYVLSLNIKKAFASVSWLYLHYILRHWRFGPHFTRWISSLYSHLKSYLKYLGYKLYYSTS